MNDLVRPWNPFRDRDAQIAYRYAEGDTQCEIAAAMGLSQGTVWRTMRRIGIAVRKGHEQSGSPAHRSWEMMHQRCRNPNFPPYQYYGAKGVTVCERWNDFATFLADMGERPEGTSLDRYPDRGGNYEPGNCRWATRHEQQQNVDANVLNAEIVRDIRASSENCSRIAKRLGVSPSTVYKARAGGTWPNVDGGAA